MTILATIKDLTEKKTYNKCTLNKYNNQAQNMQSFVL